MTYMVGEKTGNGISFSINFIFEVGNYINIDILKKLSLYIPSQLWTI